MLGSAKPHYIGVLLAAAVLAGSGIAGCGQSGEKAEYSSSGNAAAVQARFVPGDVDSLPRIQYADGQVSLNDRCPVRQVPLNNRMPPVYVNGRPVGFC